MTLSAEPPTTAPSSPETAGADERIWRNAAPAPSSPMLSVLTPVYAYDCTALIERLAGAARSDAVEVIFVDDGSPTPAPVRAIEAAAAQSRLSITLIALGRNGGRAAARNRLLRAARAPHVLFLDADMLPDAPDFLDRWIDVIERQAPKIAFGGFTVDQAPRRAETELHRFIAARSDCKPATERARDPAQTTATSNLLVARDVLAALPFDEGFVGWGWEDVEWALRSHARFPIVHVDNTATHVGLDDEHTLLRKIAQAGPNYRRLVDRHPQAVARFRSYRAARAMKALPLPALRAALTPIIHMRALPVRVRAAALKLVRTATYAEHLA